MYWFLLISFTTGVFSIIFYRIMGSFELTCDRHFACFPMTAFSLYLFFAEVFLISPHSPLSTYWFLSYLTFPFGVTIVLYILDCRGSQPVGLNHFGGSISDTLQIIYLH